jgi:CRP-like cAMP-binding protein
VEVAILDREEFLHLIDEAPAMQAGLASVAMERLQEHQAHELEGCGNG